MPQRLTLKRRSQWHQAQPPPSWTLSSHLDRERLNPLQREKQLSQRDVSPAERATSQENPLPKNLARRLGRSESLWPKRSERLLLRLAAEKRVRSATRKGSQ